MAKDSETKTTERGSETNPRGIAQREKILDIATELFASHGYKGTGMLEIAKRVGMSHAGILYHFGTKENLLRAVLARRDRLHDDLIADFQEIDDERREKLHDNVVADFRSTGLATFLGKYATAANNLMEPEVLTRLVAVLRAENLNPGDPLYEMFDFRTKQTREFIAAEIRSGQEGGDYRADIDPDAKAVEILAFIIGLEMQWLLNKSAIDLEKVYASFVRALVDDLAQPDG
jgi:AcrR family transcriptional regulator